jgi:hypothetical protein
MWLDDVPSASIACWIHLVTGHTNMLLVCTVISTLNTVLVQCVPTAQLGRSSGFGLGGTGQNCPLKSFMACSPYQIMFGLPNQWR